MDNQENWEETQEFDLDSILSEFGSGAGEDAPQVNAEDGDVKEYAPEEAPAQPEGDDPDLDRLLEEAPAEEANQRPTLVFDPVVPEEKTATDDATIVMEAVSEITEEEVPQPKQEPIPFRSNLQELKRKIVAGPEKRYYDLSDVGVFKLQIAILLNLLVVGLCVATTTMFTMGMVPENRLRLVIFSQVLGMLLSALLGCYQIMDGIADLFRGRFNINTMLFFTLLACLADAAFCLQELRVPCCACFALEMAFALFGRYHRRSTEISQMDTLRKAIHLHSVVKEDNYLDGAPVLLRGEGDVDDFLDTYSKPSGPERVQSVYCFFALCVCLGLSVLAGLRHGVSLAVQVLSTSLLAAVPASFFVALTRPAALLESRLHMVGSVICGWQGVVKLRGKAYFPMRDSDLFPTGSTKLNGVKFYGDRNPDQVIAYATALIRANGGGLEPVFSQLLKNRNGQVYTLTNFRDYGTGGIGGEILGESVLLGTPDFLETMGVEIPDGTMVSQAVYCAIDGSLSAVFAISYAKMKSAAAGLVTLCGYRKLIPVLVCDDFMLTESFLRSKFGVNTRRIAFPAKEVRDELAKRKPEADLPALALTTRDGLAPTAYAITGSRALRTACTLGLVIHMLGGILGMLIMLVLAYLGSAELLTPVNVLLYQLVWLVPGLLITEWTRTV